MLDTRKIGQWKLGCDENGEEVLCMCGLLIVNPKVILQFGVFRPLAKILHHLDDPRLCQADNNRLCDIFDAIVRQVQDAIEVFKNAEKCDAPMPPKHTTEEINGWRMHHQTVARVRKALDDRTA